MSLTVLRFPAFCLIIILLISEVMSSIIRVDRSKRAGKCEQLSASNIPDLAKTDPSDLKAVLKFIKSVDEQTVALIREWGKATFTYTTNLTEHNKEKMTEIGAKYEQFYLEAAGKVKSFDWQQIKEQNTSIHRWFKLFFNELNDTENSNYEKYLSSPFKQKSMSEIFNDARVCPYLSKSKSECILSLNPGIITIMSKSRNPSELQHIWLQFRDETGKKMRNRFIKHAANENRRAKQKGFSDFGERLRSAYESKTFAEDMAMLMRDIQPLYTQFHAYIRKKLVKYYKLDIPEDSPIPAHLTGNTYAQVWSNIYDIVNPFPKKQFPNVTEILIKNEMEPLDLLVIAEQFFLSIGLERMTPYFWARSLFVKPEDRQVVCNAAAMDLANGKDFRIRMCARVTEGSLITAHHEMGHVEYYMQYKDLLHAFRGSANAGFHEAVGEVITLSSMTPDYLKSLELMDKDIVEDEEFEIAYLVKVALQYLPTIPYAYIIDLYRYGVYNGSIPKEKLNWYWWKYRLDYQGVCPPVERTEEDFDAGAKFHVASIIEYMRYFFANIMTFQMHKSLCKEAEHEGPLHKCNIYGKKKAGDLLRKVLRLGKSVHWKEVMSILTSNETSSLESGPFLEFFKPLSDWLKKENEKGSNGWNSDDPLTCPSNAKRND